ARPARRASRGRAARRSATPPTRRSPHRAWGSGRPARSGCCRSGSSRHSSDVVGVWCWRPPGARSRDAAGTGWLLEGRAVVPDQGAHPVRGPGTAAGALEVVPGELALAALAGQEVGAGADRPRLAGGGLALAVHPPLGEVVGDPELLREAEQPVQHLDHVGALHAREGDADLDRVAALGGAGEHVGSSEIGGWSGWGVARLKAGP